MTLRHSSTTAQRAHVCHGTTRSHGAHSCQQHRVGRRRRGSDERRRTLLSVRELLDAFQHGVGSVCPRARPAARVRVRLYDLTRVTPSHPRPSLIHAAALSPLTSPPRGHVRYMRVARGGRADAAHAASPAGGPAPLGGACEARGGCCRSARSDGTYKQPSREYLNGCPSYLQLPRPSFARSLRPTSIGGGLLTPRPLRRAPWQL